MDLDTATPFHYNAPQYVDFDLVKNGMDDSDADEWFDRWGASPAVETNILVAKTPTNTNEEPSTIETENTPTTDARNDEGLTKQQKREENLKLFGKCLKKLNSKTLGSPKRLLNKRPSALKATEKIHQQLASASRKPMKALRSVGGSLALPKTPEVVRRYRLKEQTNKIQKTAEERELEDIQRMQQETKKKLILSQKSLKKSRATNSQATINPVKSSKPPTEAVGFHFRTEERLRKRSGNRPRGVSPSTSAEFDFPATLRRSDSTSFSSRRSLRNKSFTPSQLTAPRTPKLQSRQRSRPVKVLGFTEQEDMQVEEMKRYKFKAKPVNKEIFRMGGLYGLKQGNSSEQTTIPHSPQLATKTRGSRKRSLTVTEEEEHNEFKANPFPREMFERVQGVPERQCLSITTAQTPAVLRKKRRVEVEDDKEMVSVPKAQPMPDFTNTFKPQLSHKKTDTQPFSFEGLYRTKDEVVEELINEDEMAAAEKREFTASKLPDLAKPPVLPPKIPAAKIQVEPFELRTDKRGEIHKRTFSAKVNEELEKLQQMTAFRASDAKTIYNKPFVPTRSSKPLTESNGPVGHTEHRLEERAKFDSHVKKNQEMKEQIESERQAMLESEDAKQIKKLRRTLVHKAQPIQNYAPIKVLPSLKKPTTSLGPKLISGSRLRGRN